MDDETREEVEEDIHRQEILETVGELARILRMLEVPKSFLLDLFHLIFEKYPPNMISSDGDLFHIRTLESQDPLTMNSLSEMMICISFCISNCISLDICLCISKKTIYKCCRPIHIDAPHMVSVAPKSSDKLQALSIINLNRELDIIHLYPV